MASAAICSSPNELVLSKMRNFGDVIIATDKQFYNLSLGWLVVPLFIGNLGDTALLHVGIRTHDDDFGITSRFRR